jgi:hypothetical protein
MKLEKKKEKRKEKKGGSLDALSPINDHVSMSTIGPC